jgi:hypothetical protein
MNTIVRMTKVQTGNLYSGVTITDHSHKKNFYKTKTWKYDAV